MYCTDPLRMSQAKLAKSCARGVDDGKSQVNGLLEANRVRVIPVYMKVQQIKYKSFNIIGIYYRCRLGKYQKFQDNKLLKIIIHCI